MPTFDKPAVPIRVLIADDSAFMRAALIRMLESDPQIKVLGAAQNGLDALEKTEQLDPDVITLDLEMPRLDGLSTLRHIMEKYPRPVIVVSSQTREGAEATLEAFDLGAFDCIPKQLVEGRLGIIKIRDELVAKVKAAAAQKMRRHLRTPRLGRPAPQPQPAADAVAPSIVAMGSSTGGPQALQQILSALPADFPVPIVVVQHMPLGFTGPFAARLNTNCRIHVSEAAPNLPLRPGYAWIAPAGWQLRVARNESAQVCLDLSKDPQNTPHIPSVDVMMRSVADVYRNRAMGVILTGMGADGMLGMSAIYNYGGYTVGQDEHSCAVYGMPRASAEAGVLRRVLPLSSIADEMMMATRMSAVAHQS